MSSSIAPIISVFFLVDTVFNILSVPNHFSAGMNSNGLIIHSDNRHTFDSDFGDWLSAAQDFLAPGNIKFVANFDNCFDYQYSFTFEGGNDFRLDDALVSFIDQKLREGIPVRLLSFYISK